MQESDTGLNTQGSKERCAGLQERHMLEGATRVQQRTHGVKEKSLVLAMQAQDGRNKTGGAGYLPWDTGPPKGEVLKISIGGSEVQKRTCSR